MKRVGLFGGSFDPPHPAHLALANAALHQLPLHELWWVPVGDPWQKAGRRLASGEHRVAMIECLLRTLPEHERAQHRIEPCELERTGPSYTIDTVLELQSRHPGCEWWLLLGGDQLANLPTWKRWTALREHVKLAALKRLPEVAEPQGTDGLPLIQPDAWLSVPPSEVSSTVIRQHIRAGRPIGERLPPALAGYIDQHRLYQEATPESETES